MLRFLKYLPLVLAFQDVSDRIKEGKQAGRPWFLQRSIIGLIIGAICLGFSIQFGVEVSQEEIKVATDNLMQIISLIGAGYGAALSLYGFIMKIVKKVKEKVNATK